MHLLIAGLFSRVVAFGAASVMTVAVLTVHAAIGFFMNWYGNQKGEGFEYHLLAFGLALIVLIHGGGGHRPSDSEQVERQRCRVMN